MSELRQEQTFVDATTLAADINSGLLYVAEKLPANLKSGAAGTTVEICAVDGVGKVDATYFGKVAAGSDPLDNFNVRVRMMVEGYGGRLGFAKFFALTYESYKTDGGPVVDKQPAVAEDFDDCPGGQPTLEVLAFTLHALLERYKKLRAT